MGFWWDEEDDQRIGPIFPDTPPARRMQRLYIRCLDALYRDQPPPVTAVYAAARDLGHRDADAAALIDAAHAERDERR